LEDLALTEALRSALAALMALPKLIGHVLLFGPQGTGKTTIGSMLARHFLGDAFEHRTHHVEASVESGNAHAQDLVVRMRTRTLLSVLDPDQHEFIILNEGGGLSRKAQETLLGPLEQYGSHIRGIFTCNDPNRLISPLRSRCIELEVLPPPVSERARVLEGVLVAEDVEYDPAALVPFADRFHDLRQMVRQAQFLVALHGSFRQPILPDDDRAAGVAALPSGLITCDEMLLRLSAFLTRVTEKMIPTSVLQRELGVPGSSVSAGKRIARCLAPRGARSKPFASHGKTVWGYETEALRRAVAEPPTTT
jgi:hypothetical protein